MKTTAEVKAEILKKTLIPELTENDYVSSGSTLLNLAITNNPYWGFAKGKYYRFVGDSASGKTFICLTCLAEASINPAFDNYRFIFDDVEGGAMMDIQKFFGKRVTERLEAPAISKAGPVFSGTIEDFYYNVDDAIQKGQPFIYILDSMDAITSQDEDNKFEQLKKAHRSHRKTTGSMGDGKAKKNSGMIRKILKGLRDTKSILIVIGQTRDKIKMGWASKFDPETQTTSGGKSLKFYATLELWSSVRSKITKKINEKKKELGTNCRIHVKKNRMNGKDRIIMVPIYHSFGIDNIGSCVDFLVEEGHWKKKAASGIIAPELNLQGTKEALIRKIEKKGLEKELIELVHIVWNEIEKQCEIVRKFRYA